MRREHARRAAIAVVVAAIVSLRPRPVTRIAAVALRGADFRGLHRQTGSRLA